MSLEDDLNRLDAQVAEANDLSELALLGRIIDMLVTNLQVIRRTVSDKMADRMTEQKTLLRGIGQIERYRSSTWKPYNPGSQIELVRTVAEAGRKTHRSPRAAAQEACFALSQAASLSWRINTLREYGIDPHKFLDNTHGDWVVKIPKE